MRQILEQFKTGYGEIEIGLSVVTVVELTHGIQRAKLEERRQRRQALLTSSFVTCRISSSELARWN